MAPIVLRDYQLQLLADLRTALKRHKRVCAVMPTGAGKGQTIGAIARGAAGKGRRVLVLAHRAELIEQLSATVWAWGLEPDLIVPGHQLQGRQVAVGSVQTVARRLAQLPAPDLIIQDEAHHLVAGNVWGRIINAWPGAHLIGKTATPERLDGKGLGVEAGGFFEALVLGPSAAWLVEQGWLARPRVFSWPGARNSKLRRRMGDFDLEQAARAFGDRAAIGDAVSHYRRRLHPATAICFCCTIQHAEQLAGAFRADGIRAAAVSGSTPAEERRRLIAGLGTGEVQVLTSCMIISEGTDIPSVGGAILMRPTASLSLYLQMVGRALRSAPGKGEAVILDHVGNAHRHGLPTDEREWNLAGRKRREGVSIPIKDCPLCFCSCPSAAQQCPDCGHLFLSEERDEQRRGLQQIEGDLVEIVAGAHRPKPRQQQRPRRRSPSAGCRSFEQLQQREQERGYKPGWARHVWAARQRGLQA
ncbi:DEAD/DEAH box helicase [Synechococcus sp. CS-1324]|uniref:DEAD/DEAH box helicase n=1 Tax=Synechococcus sp. CS-1324 TaxID=2847980 RepID=UPI000DB6FBD3|nr:DEAD/DEAH box helicase [Synechococcus sp. CS-1324]MCT0229748.1 DEAD/DEAH box helicase [Synechococcus sp. CS-1324]PZV03406.1 MAG: helicase [Cyanobium sp.]